MKEGYNVILGIPSGILLNCTFEIKMKLYYKGYLRYRSSFNSYAFFDKNINKVLNIIYNNINVGQKIYHKKYGNGEIIEKMTDKVTVQIGNIEMFINIDKIINDFDFILK